MSIVSDKIIYYINSHNRATGTHSDFTYDLKLQPGHEYDRAVVLQMIIPKSYYLIQNGYNTFTLRENLLDTTITLPEGSYNRRTLAIVIQNLLNSLSPNNWTYTITYDNASVEPDTGKYYFQVSGNSSQPSFIFSTFVYEQMGFDANSTNTFISDHLTSSNVIKLQAEDTLYLHSDLIQNEYDNVLQEVFAGANSATFQNIHWQCLDTEAYSKPVKMAGSQFRFYLTDENDQQIDLNGQNMQIVLLLYKNNAIYKKISEYIDYRVS